MNLLRDLRALVACRRRGFDRRVSLTVLALVLANALRAYEQVAPPPNVVLPPPRSAQESLAAIKVPAGFRVELVAAEPLVMDPIDIAWGADGRIWVVEMADYPNGLDDKGQAGGRVRVIESSRGDGVYDKSTLFAEGLNFPNSVLPWRKGALVVAAPDILYLEDLDGDGRADRVEKRFSGFGEGNQQHRANGLAWGLDGWLYLANGDSGGKIISPKNDRTLDLGRRDLRVKPDEGTFEPVSGQSQWGRNRDDWGNWFSGNNSNPIWHYALDDRYLARNPHLVAPNAVVTVPAIGGPAPVYPASRTMARFNDAARLNHFTSACGTMIYRDELLGPEFAGNVFVCEPVHNLVHRQIVRPQGATFTSRRAPGEEAAEFLASADNWSRFTAARTGPDGALYIVDMYRLTIEHPKWIPEAWLKILGGVRAGHDKGRIYRVVRENVPLRAVPRLDRADLAGLVEALENPNGTVRDLAQQELTWRKDRAAVPALEELVVRSLRPQTRVQALCTLDTMAGLTPAAVAAALRDSHSGVLRQAVRLSEQFAAADNGELLARIIALVGHTDATVRQQVAYSLGEWKQAEAGEALARLIRQNDDPFIRAAALSSAPAHAGTLFTRLGAGDDHRGAVDLAVATRNTKALTEILRIFAETVGPVESVARFTFLTHVLDGLQRSNQSLATLRSTADEAMLTALVSVAASLAEARRVAGDAKVSPESRVAAIALLGREPDKRDFDAQLLSALLVPQSPVEVQLAALSAIGRIGFESAPERVLSGWSGYGPKVRGAAVDLLASRSGWTDVLLDRIASDPALLVSIDLGRRAALTRHGNVKIAERASRIFGSSIDPNRQQVITRYMEAMRSLRRDAARGATVFANSCAACHQFGKVPGRAIGPDLASLKDRSAEYLVAHILDPNRAVEDRYVLSSVGTRDGRIFAGMLTAEAGNNITLLGLDGVEQVILRADVKSITTTGRSLMPDGLEAAIAPQMMADLVAFVAGEGDAKE